MKSAFTLFRQECRQCPSRIGILLTCLPGRGKEAKRKAVYIQQTDSFSRAALFSSFLFFKNLFSPVPFFLGCTPRKKKDEKLVAECELIMQ